MEKEEIYMEGSFLLTDDDKKKEMNLLILDILRKTGIGRITTKRVSGRDILTFKKASFDENGIAELGFSIVEKKNRDGYFYNSNTGELVTKDWEYNHFDLTSLMIMAVLEAYSEKPCYVMNGDKLFPITLVARFIEEITGKELNFVNRSHIIDTIIYFKRQDKYRNFKYDATMYPYDYCSEDNDDQFSFYFYDLKFKIDAYKRLYDYADESAWKYKKAYMCMQLLRENSKLKYEALEYIKQLMDLNLDERRKEKEKKHFWDQISDAAVFLPAAFLVKIYAEAYNEDFFELWSRIGKKGYWDVDGLDLNETSKEKKNYKPEFRLSQLYQLENEDVFIGIWNSDGMIISKLMEKNLKRYKEYYSGVDEDNLIRFDTVFELLKCIDELNTFWNCDRFIDYDLLDEFINNKNNICYKKAVFVLRKMIADEISLFSELSETQIRNWIIKRVNWKYYSDMYWNYLDVLNNKKRRKELFGF